MAQASNITINDGQATPVAKTFNPEAVTPSLSTFVERTAGIAAGFIRLSVSTLFSNGKRTTNRARFNVALPITAVVDGNTVVVRTLRANCDVILPDGCTDAERKDLYAYLYNGLNHTLIKGAVRDLDPLY